MPFDWKEFLNLSRFLAGQSAAGLDVEAAHRSAVSRAYYAAFCHARNYAQDREGFAPEYDSSDHQGVRNHLRSRAGFSGIPSKLDALRQRRNRSDYNDSVPSLSNDLAAAMREAEDVLARLL
jgi:uncharacterized protein (UPF0332 family)